MPRLDVEAHARAFAEKVGALEICDAVPQGLRTMRPLVEVRRSEGGSVYVRSGQLFTVRFADHPPGWSQHNVTHDCWGRSDEAVRASADLVFRKLDRQFRRRRSRALFLYWGDCAGHHCSAVALDAHSR